MLRIFPLTGTDVTAVFNYMMMDVSHHILGISWQLVSIMEFRHQYYVCVGCVCAPCVCVSSCVCVLLCVSCAWEDGGLGPRHCEG